MNGTTINNKLSTRTAGGRSKYREVIQRIGLAMMSAVVAIGFSLAPVTKVFASSDWDTAWRTTSDLSLESPSCGTIDETTAIWAQLASTSGWPNGGTVWSPNDSVQEYYHDITSGSVPGFISIVKTHQKGTDWTWVSVYAQQGSSFTAIWGNDGSNGHYVRIPGASFGSTSFSGQWLGFMLDDGTCDMTFGSIGGTIVAYLSNAGDGTVYSMENIKLQFNNGAILDPNYPEGYEGSDLGPATDGDDDGLTAAQEFTQGTSDSKKDTDGDGLDDLTESIWFENREDVFCKTSTTPHVCAYPDPLKKDVYVEVDWIDDGTNSYEPSNTQLGLIADKFENLGINFHADSGEYGGGNAIEVNFDTTTTPITLPPGSMPSDFYTYKYGDGAPYYNDANFDAINRYKIWHYVISGYNFDDGTGSTNISGRAEPGGDDIFLSYGYIEDNQLGFGYTDFNDAIAGTIIHELGHNLCLAETSYTGQDSLCLFGGIDHYSSSNYHSAMNYNYQFTNDYSYSDGTHGISNYDDHDDQSAILNYGIDDFQNDDDSSVGGPA